MSYTVRLHARMLAGLYFPGRREIIVAGMPAIEIAPQPASPEEEFAAREMGGPMNYTFIARGFETEAGALDGFGVDVGSGPPTLSFSQAAREAMSKAAGGKAILSDGLGLTVYENDSVQFIGASALGRVEHDVQFLGLKMAAWMESASRLTEKERICALLLNDAQFVAQGEAKFILCVSAVEALCDEIDRSTGHVAIIGVLIDHLDEIGGDPLDVDAIRKALLFQKKRSVRQGYLTKIRASLGDETAKEFDALYDMRSAFIHSGKHRGALPAHRASEIATALLKAELQV